MSILRRFAAVVCASSPLFVGCVQGGSIEAEDVGQASLADKNGSTGLNGLGWTEFKAVEADLILAASGGPVADPDSMEVTADIEKGLLATPAGETVFHYAVACMVPAGLEVTWGQGTAEGKGHLASGEAWLKGGLGDEEIEDMLACVIAHINPYGLEVPVLFSGSHVQDDKLDHSDFWVDEALWIAQMSGPGRADYIVYPLKAVILECGPDPQQALMDRLCGQSPATCSFGVGDLDDCVETAEGFECLGQPALMTTLMTDGFSTMWASCYN